ncbi:hypothetical protein N7465_006992 [Penicillium sp. CMV-2018d]|nr:hypothetical protein N7465_006992 [Penicillium sp. CMV-2018d]
MIGYELNGNNAPSFKSSKRPNARTQRLEHNSNNSLKNSQTGVEMLYLSYLIEGLFVLFQSSWVFVEIWTSPFFMSRRTNWTSGHLNMPFRFSRGISKSFDRRPCICENPSEYPWSAIKALSQGWPSQGRPIDNHYHSSSDQSKQTGTVQFVSVFGYEKEGAREEWYSDFSQRAQTQYDLLGHIVDWLRTLSKQITIQCLRLENDDPWMIADKQAKRERLPSPVPPSIFDTPWANNTKDGFWQVKSL